MTHKPKKNHNMKFTIKRTLNDVLVLIENSSFFNKNWTAKIIERNSFNVLRLTMDSEEKNMAYFSQVFVDSLSNFCACEDLSFHISASLDNGRIVKNVYFWQNQDEITLN